MKGGRERQAERETERERGRERQRIGTKLYFQKTFKMLQIWGECL